MKTDPPAQPAALRIPANGIELSVVVAGGGPEANVPVMGVWSDGDAFLAVAQMVDSKRYVLAPFRYERVDGANHWLQLTAPERVNALLLDYLR